MISGFRKSLRSWATLLLLFLALVAIVITGFGTGGGGGIGALGGGGDGAPAGDQLATVGGQPITATQVSDQLNQAFQQLRRQAPNLEMAEFLNQGGYEGAVDALVNFAAMRQYGEARGLIVTRQMVDRYIANLPMLRDAMGEFDPNKFQTLLQNLGVTEAYVRDDIARELIRQQLLDPVKLGARVPQGVARAYALARLERRRGMVGVVPVGALAQGINPTDAEIAAYYARRRAALTVPERRVVKYALIGPEQVSPPAPTEAEIAAVYRNTPRYAQRETRTLQSITFTGASAQATAQAFAQRVRGGTAFLDAARQAGFAPSDVTFADRSQSQFASLTSAEVAATVFRAAQNSVTGPVRSPLGVHVIRVERITPIAGQPLAAVRPAIVAELERRKRAAAVAALSNRLLERIDEGASFEDAAREARLTIVTTPPITATGLQANGEPWAVPAELRPVLAAAFEIDADDPEPTVAAIQPNARYALLGVDRVDPPAAPPLAQIRERVRTALIREQALARARDLANRIAARISAGTPAARAFAEAQPRLPAPQPVNARRLDVMRPGRQIPPALLALFRIRPGTAEVVEAPNEGWIVIAAEESTSGDAAEAAGSAAQIQRELAESAPDELEMQFLRAIELRANVQRNEAAIRAQRRQLLANLAPAQ